MGLVPNDFISMASIIAGFGITVFMFRVQREVAVLDMMPPKEQKPAQTEHQETGAKEGENAAQGDNEQPRAYLAWADYLVLVSVFLCFLTLILLVLSEADRTLRAVGAMCAAAVVLQLAYIPATMAHYSILMGEPTTTENRKPAQPIEKWMVPISFFVAAVVGYVAWCLPVHHCLCS